MRSRAARRPRSFSPAAFAISGADIRSLAIGAIAAALTVLPVGAQSLDERLPTCFACHGDKGTSQLPDTPSLGAQPAFYTTVQLLMFRDRLRVSGPMNEMTKGLTDADLQRAADIIAKSPPPQPVSDNPDPARMERGRALGQQHRCNFCHQSNYAGQENVPRIASQREDYLLKALRGYKDNSRYGYDAQMSDVIYPLKDEDFADLAYFLARLN